MKAPMNKTKRPISRVAAIVTLVLLSVYGLIMIWAGYHFAFDWPRNQIIGSYWLGGFILPLGFLIVATVGSITFGIFDLYCASRLQLTSALRTAYVSVGILLLLSATGPASIPFSLLSHDAPLDHDWRLSGRSELIGQWRDGINLLILGADSSFVLTYSRSGIFGNHVDSVTGSWRLDSIFTLTYVDPPVTSTRDVPRLVLTASKSGLERDFDLLYCRSQMWIADAIPEDFDAWSGDLGFCKDTVRNSAN